jgi:hypothetical protein
VRGFGLLAIRSVIVASMTTPISVIFLTTRHWPLLF